MYKEEIMKNLYSPLITRHSSLYLHVPFCLSKCGYCAFYSIVPSQDLKNKYFEKLAADFENEAEKLGSFKTIFVGGGNPTALGEKGAAKFVELFQRLDLSETAEITFESNPETLSEEVLNILCSLKKLRISMGIQRLSDDELTILDRKARMKNVLKAAEMLSEKKINFSCDFILGVPFCASIADSLKMFIGEFNPNHISAYMLSVEEGTPLCEKVRTGEFPHDSTVGTEEYFQVRDLLISEGYTHYEISNFAKNGFESLHNLNYWLCGDYLGLGPAAVSTKGNIRRSFPDDFETWLKGEEEIEELSEKDKFNEFVMLALRLIRGLDITELKHRFGEIPQEFYNGLEKNLNQGLLVENAERVRLTDKGLTFVDQAIAELFL